MMRAVAAIRGESLRRSRMNVVARCRATTRSQHPSPLAAAAGRVDRSFAARGGSRGFSAQAEDNDDKPIIPGIGKGKTSTGLVGLAVEPDWYNVMLHKFQALLDKMEASDMPETAQYRIDVTKWCHYVIKTVKEHPDDPEAVEDAVRMGQVEELIEMADDEMICLDTYLETRMWEVVARYNPTIDFQPNPLRDPMAEDGDPTEQEHIRKGNEPRK